VAGKRRHALYGVFAQVFAVDKLVGTFPPNASATVVGIARLFAGIKGHLCVLYRGVWIVARVYVLNVLQRPVLPDQSGKGIAVLSVALFGRLYVGRRTVRLGYLVVFWRGQVESLPCLFVRFALSRRPCPRCLLAGR